MKRRANYRGVSRSTVESLQEERQPHRRVKWMNKPGTAEQLIRGGRRHEPHKPGQALTEVSAAYPAAPSHRTNEINKKGFVSKEE